MVMVDHCVPRRCLHGDDGTIAAVVLSEDIAMTEVNCTTFLYEDISMTMAFRHQLQVSKTPGTLNTDCCQAGECVCVCVLRLSALL